MMCFTVNASGLIRRDALTKNEHNIPTNSPDFSFEEMPVRITLCIEISGASLSF